MAWYGSEMRRSRQRRVAVVLLLAGMLEMLLASQQRFFWLAERWYTHRTGPSGPWQTVLSGARSASWELSLISAVLSVVLAIFLTVRLPAAFCSIACKVFALWGVIYCLLYLLAEQEGMGVMYPAKPWHEAYNLHRFMFDWTYIVGWLVGLLTITLGLWGANVAASWSPEWDMKCQKCKYDLTGNASRFCPECGLELTQLQSWFASGKSHSMHYSDADAKGDG